jgi:DegV family protein with EDD domain
VPTPATPLLITDSCCDLSADLLARRGVSALDYPVILDGIEQVDESGRPVGHALFYERVRAGAAPSTAAIPIPSYAEAFRAGVSQGRPVVLLGLSSALSGTFERALMARDIVLAEYPGADIRVVESLSASIALGLLVLEAADRIDDGASIDELTSWLDPARVSINAYFTLETLEHLRRGGRISDVAAMAGAVLDIKPILRIDETGALVISEKLRGRRKSMAMLVDILVRRFDGRRILVGHGDSPEDAERLAAMVRERAGTADVIVTEVGPVIGSHVGPGMLALAFVGTERSAV